MGLEYLWCGLEHDTTHIRSILFRSFRNEEHIDDDSFEFACDVHNEASS